MEKNQTHPPGNELIFLREELPAEMTLQQIRQAVGKDFPIALRLGGYNYEAGERTVEDCVEACRLLEQTGVDLLHLTGSTNGYILVRISLGPPSMKIAAVKTAAISHLTI